jgi:hypothetical protein
LNWGWLIGLLFGGWIHKFAKITGEKSSIPNQIICPNSGLDFELNREDIYCTACGNELRKSRAPTYTLIVLGTYAMWFTHIFGILTPKIANFLLWVTGDEKFSCVTCHYSSVNSYAETLLFVTIFTGGIFTVPIGFVAGKGYLDGTDGVGHLKALLIGLLPGFILNIIIFSIFVF